MISLYVYADLGALTSPKPANLLELAKTGCKLAALLSEGDYKV